MIRWRLLLAVAWTMLAGIVVGGAGQAAAAPTTLPALDVPHATTRPHLDGRADDPAWADAAVVPALTPSVRVEPSVRPEAAPQAVPTQVRLMWDEHYLYIRFIAQDDEIYVPYKVHDGPLYRGDVAEVFLDVKGDGRQWIEVQVDPDNHTLDKLFTLTDEPRSDKNGRLLDDVVNRDLWENLDWTLDGLRSGTGRSVDHGQVTGWIVDIAIPAAGVMRRLGTERFSPMVLHANLLRYEWSRKGDDAHGELLPVNWAPVAFGCPHISPRAMGVLRLVPAATPTKTGK